MPDDSFWLIASCAAVWIGVGLYLVFLGRKQASLEKRLRRAEALNNAD